MEGKKVSHNILCFVYVLLFSRELDLGYWILTMDPHPKQDENMLKAFQGQLSYTITYYYYMYYGSVV